jgi:spore germination protein GerM
VRHITATLFYGSDDGQFLVPLKREVPFGEGPVEQGRQIVLAQLQQQAPPPLVSAIPPGTTLRRFYVSDRGDAFVDLGSEVTANHPGGSVAELFTVYAIVNAVTANLPAISRVQILVDGREVDTLAGHVDLRRPLLRNDTLVRQDGSQ